MTTAKEHLTTAIVTFAVQATGFASSVMEEVALLKAAGADAGIVERLEGISRGFTQTADQAREALKTAPAD